MDLDFSGGKRWNETRVLLTIQTHFKYTYDIRWLCANKTLSTLKMDLIIEILFSSRYYCTHFKVKLFYTVYSNSPNDVVVFVVCAEQCFTLYYECFDMSNAAWKRETQLQWSRDSYYLNAVFCLHLHILFAHNNTHAYTNSKPKGRRFCLCVRPRSLRSVRFSFADKTLGRTIVKLLTMPHTVI